MNKLGHEAFPVHQTIAGQAENMTHGTLIEDRSNLNSGSGMRVAFSKSIGGHVKFIEKE